MIQTLRTKLAALVAAGGLAAAAHAQPPAPTQPPIPPGPPPGVQTVPPVPGQPRVIRYPGGYVVIDGPEVVVRQPGTPGGPSVNVVTGSGNGTGNNIVVTNGPGGGVTVVQGSRNGTGNTISVGPNDVVVDVPGVPPTPVVPVPPGQPGQPGQPVPVVPPPTGPIPPAQPMGGAPTAVPATAAPQPATPARGPELLVYKGKDNKFWTQKVFSDAHDCNLYWSPNDKLWFRYNKDDDTYRPVLDGPPPPQG